MALEQFSLLYMLGDRVLRTSENDWVYDNIVVRLPSIYGCFRHNEILSTAVNLDDNALTPIPRLIGTSPSRLFNINQYLTGLFFGEYRKQELIEFGSICQGILNQNIFVDQHGSLIAVGVEGTANNRDKVLQFIRKVYRAIRYSLAPQIGQTNNYEYVQAQCIYDIFGYYGLQSSNIIQVEIVNQGNGHALGRLSLTALQRWVSTINIMEAFINDGVDQKALIKVLVGMLAISKGRKPSANVNDWANDYTHDYQIGLLPSVSPTITLENVKYVTSASNVVGVTASLLACSELVMDEMDDSEDEDDN